MSTQNQAPSLDDYAAIRRVIGLYIQAGKDASSAVAKPAFHKDAIIYGVSDGAISGGPIQSLYDFFDSHPKATELQADTVAIDIAGTAAWARVESDKWHGARYSDMFLLLKGADGWQIITKIFHTH